MSRHTQHEFDKQKTKNKTKRGVYMSLDNIIFGLLFKLIKILNHVIAYNELK